MQQQLDVLMTGHAWGQQSMLNQLGAIAQRRLQLQQQQSDKTALKVNRLGGMFARKPHYELPAGLTDASLTLLLQQPLKLHDMVNSTVSALHSRCRWKSTAASTL